MNFTEYSALFDQILSDQHPKAPYDNPDYMEYTKLNASRQNRWMKKGELLTETVTAIKNLRAPQQWILISEPWCGDAAHNVPFLVQLAALNPLISLDIQLRDQPPFLIDNYLTNGGKSIPKLVVRDAEGKDLFTWGPRPVPAQELMMDMKQQQLELGEQKIHLQNWYNTDKGVTLQKELVQLLQAL